MTGVRIHFEHKILLVTVALTPRHVKPPPPQRTSSNTPIRRNRSCRSSISARRRLLAQPAELIAQGRAQVRGGLLPVAVGSPDGLGHDAVDDPETEQIRAP